jgi:hypothetical protein
MNGLEKYNLKRLASKLLGDPMLFDPQELDSSLSYAENKQLLKERYGLTREDLIEIALSTPRDVYYPEELPTFEFYYYFPQLGNAVRPWRKYLYKTKRLKNGKRWHGGYRLNALSRDLDPSLPIFAKILRLLGSIAFVKAYVQFGYLVVITDFPNAQVFRDLLAAEFHGVRMSVKPNAP